MKEKVKAVAERRDPIALFVLTIYACAREVWPEFELSQDTLLLIAATGAALFTAIEGKKRAKQNKSKAD